MVTNEECLFADEVAALGDAQQGPGFREMAAMMSLQRTKHVESGESLVPHFCLKLLHRPLADTITMNSELISTRLPDRRFPVLQLQD